MNKFRVIADFGQKHFDKIAISVLFLLTVYLALAISIPQLMGIVGDDSLFYLKIARNFSRGYGSTFDQIQPTNGYHPLWMFVLSGLFYPLNLVGLKSPEIQFRVALILNFLIVFFSIYLSIRIIRHLNRSRKLSNYSKVALFVYLIAFPFSAAYLMEEFLLVLIIVLLLHEYVHKKYNLMYILIPLVFLTRIDLFPLTVFLCGYTLYKDTKEGIKSCISVVVVVGLYLGLNFHFFSHFIEVSAYLKTQLFNRSVKAQLARLRNRLSILSIFYFSSLFLYLFNVYKAKIDSWQKEIYNLLFIVATGGFLYILGMLFYNNNLRAWYFIWPLFITGIFLIIGLEILKHNISTVSLANFSISSSFITLGLTSLITLVSVSGILYLGISRNWHRPEYTYALWVKKYIPEDEPLFQVDSAGQIGYFSDRKVISADGLVGSFTYVDKLYSNKLCEFLTKNQVKYLGLDDFDRKRVIGKDNIVEWRGNSFKVKPLKSYKQEYYLYRIECY